MSFIYDKSKEKINNIITNFKLPKVLKQINFKLKLVNDDSSCSSKNEDDTNKEIPNLKATTNINTQLKKYSNFIYNNKKQEKNKTSVISNSKSILNNSNSKYNYKIDLKITKKLDLNKTSSNNTNNKINITNNNTLFNVKNNLNNTNVNTSVKSNNFNKFSSTVKFNKYINSNININTDKRSSNFVLFNKGFNIKLSKASLFSENFLFSNKRLNKYYCYNNNITNKNESYTNNYNNLNFSISNNRLSTFVNNIKYKEYCDNAIKTVKSKKIKNQNITEPKLSVKKLQIYSKLNYLDKYLNKDKNNDTYNITDINSIIDNDLNIKNNSILSKMIVCVKNKHIRKNSEVREKAIIKLNNFKNKISSHKYNNLINILNRNTFNKQLLNKRIIKAKVKRFFFNEVMKICDNYLKKNNNFNLKAINCITNFNNIKNKVNKNCKMNIFNNNNINNNIHDNINEFINIIKKKNKLYKIKHLKNVSYITVNNEKALKSYSYNSCKVENLSLLNKRINNYNNLENKDLKEKINKYSNLINTIKPVVLYKYFKLYKPFNITLQKNRCSLIQLKRNILSKLNNSLKKQDFNKIINNPDYNFDLISPFYGNFNLVQTDTLYKNIIKEDYYSKIKLLSKLKMIKNKQKNSSLESNDSLNFNKNTLKINKVNLIHLIKNETEKYNKINNKLYKNNPLIIKRKNFNNNRNKIFDFTKNYDKHYDYENSDNKDLIIKLLSEKIKENFIVKDKCNLIEIRSKLVKQLKGNLIKNIYLRNNNNRNIYNNLNSSNLKQSFVDKGNNNKINDFSKDLLKIKLKHNLNLSVIHNNTVSNSSNNNKKKKFS